ncbi:hypothetical protein [Aquibacillus kalidii]|uniref:hypothetical protein n=1 Tax=Aquibacillus kalidii TaxID=2762597 RepID=UPI0016468760|nr:hypothetical protein [Aquibacillus kalidii]
MRSKLLIVWVVSISFLVVACGSNNPFSDKYGFLYQEDNHLSLVKLEGDNRKVSGTYQTFDLVEEGLVKTNREFSGSLSNNKLERINIGLAKSGTVNGEQITLHLTDGKDQAFKLVSKEEFEAALKDLESKEMAVKAASVQVSAANVEKAVPDDTKTKNEQEVERGQTTVGMEQLVKLTNNIGKVKKEIINTIEEKGWYDSGQPSKQAFAEVVKPIAAEYFSETFITEHIVGQMDAFFCYCDAPGPLHGSMMPDVLANVNQEGDTATFQAYRPANDMYSGTKLDVTVVKEEDKWKIDQLTPLFGSHEKSFSLTSEQVKAYYEYRGIELELVKTIKEEEAIYIFRNKHNGSMLAVQSQDYYTAEGKEWIEQLYGEIGTKK